MSHLASADLTRRFAGTGRLYGAGALARFQAAHVAVIGIGGVGSWAAEALARSAIGEITLIDLDMLAESNVNRQIHALDPHFGQAKTSAMAGRIALINPACKVHGIEDFVTLDNLDALLNKNFSYLIDAIDHTRVKAAMIAWCLRRKIPLISAGAAGGKTDPTRIRIADLAQTQHDPLLARVRAVLRKDYGFSQAKANNTKPKKPEKFGVPAVFSDEAVRRPAAVCLSSNDPENASNIELDPAAGLNCAGYGSGVCITASFGFFAASAALRHIAESAS